MLYSSLFCKATNSKVYKNDIAFIPPGIILKLSLATMLSKQVALASKRGFPVLIFLSDCYRFLKARAVQTNGWLVLVEAKQPLFTLQSEIVAFW